jgi:hypothetical protein
MQSCRHDHQHHAATPRVFVDVPGTACAHTHTDTHTHGLPTSSVDAALAWRCVGRWQMADGITLSSINHIRHQRVLIRLNSRATDTKDHAFNATTTCVEVYIISFFEDHLHLHHCVCCGPFTSFCVTLSLFCVFWFPLVRWRHRPRAMAWIGRRRSCVLCGNQSS